MKKKNIVLMVFAVFFSMVGCRRSMDYVISNEPDFAGIVKEVTEDYVVVTVNDDESIYVDYPIVYASLDVEQEDSCLDFRAGDEIQIFYDGNISDGDPAKVETVYAICVINFN